MINVYHIGDETYYVKKMAKARYMLGTDDEGLPTIINLDTGHTMQANVIECIPVITAGTEDVE